MKAAVFGGFFIGSTVGGFLPALWGGSLLSTEAIIWTAVGSVVGIIGGTYVGRWLQGG
jgi:hypothetical protein